MTSTASSTPPFGTPEGAVASAPGDNPRLVQDVRVDLGIAQTRVPVTWPLPSLVAANPLRDFEHLPFHEATAESRRWFGADTHLSIESYRAQAAGFGIGAAQLRAAVAAVDPELIMVPAVAVGGLEVEAIDVIVDDLLNGPVAPHIDSPTSPWIDHVVEHVGAYCASFVDPHASSWALPDRERGIYVAWRNVAKHDFRLRRMLGRTGVDVVNSLPLDSARALTDALDAMGVDADQRVDALRALLMRLPGWVGLARWAEEWAPSGGLQVGLRVLDLAAILASIDVASGQRQLTIVPPHQPGTDAAIEREVFEQRVSSVVERLGLASDAATNAGTHATVAALLRRDALADRAHVWLVAHERALADQLLTTVQHADPGAAVQRPDAQIVMCIDVRSEVFRRHFEQQGNNDSLGFAGFFGIPLAWRGFGASVSEARCPVLVQPRYEIADEPVDPVAAETAQRVGRARKGARHDAKSHLGSPFAYAETMGWFSVMAAAFKTLAPARAAGQDRAAPEAPQPLGVFAEQAQSGGIGLDDRVACATAILSTIGLHRCAPLVVLCGHASSSVNNPHAASLDCGACGGAPGAVNARAAAAILNDPEVRAALHGSPIEIPTDTVFIPGEHDTTTDTVTLFDTAAVPASHAAMLERLRADLAAAGAATATERAARLPGNNSTSARSIDWAETRPEWGLARNMAFIAAPRSATAGCDLGGRAFLHSYDAETDDGSALETIMTAPLVVAQWINSQYYFSTVDPEVFGAGDKLLHNVVAGLGVTRGGGGDLAVGLPWQSVGAGDEAYHEPVRLLAMIQAPLERIEDIIARNPSVARLVDNQWIHLVARSAGDQPWMTRTPGGTWETWYAAAAFEELV